MNDYKRTYQDYLNLLDAGATVVPSPQELDGYLLDKNLHLCSIDYHNLMDKISIGQFLQLAHTQSLSDLMETLNLNIRLDELLNADWREPLLFQHYVQTKLKQFADVMEDAKCPPLPFESGASRDESLAEAHLIDYVLKRFGYHTFEQAEDHPLAEVITAMLLDKDDEMYRRQIENNIKRKR